MKSLTHLLMSITVLLVSGTDGVADVETANLHETPHVRQPVAAALCRDGRLLCVVNQRSGSVSLIDLETREVTAEVKIGERLSDVAALPDGRTLLITDEARHELLVVRHSAAAVEVIGRTPMPRSPVSVVVSDDGSSVAVAGLWSHRIALLKPLLPDDTTTVEEEIGGRSLKVHGEESALVHQPSTINHQPGFTETGIIRLPFAPRTMAFVEGATRRLVVADAFGGRIAIIDPQRGEIESVRELPAHNIRGMVVSPDGAQLLVTHQILNSLARTDFDDVHWGSLMQNVIRQLSVSTILDPGADLLDGSRRIRLGQTGNAAADPAEIAVLTGVKEEQADGVPWIVALSGVDEVSVEMDSVRNRYEVGARPVDVVWDENRNQAYVVSSLDASVTVMDMRASRNPKISLGPMPEPTPRERGERLFFDGSRSHDGWMSCHSCHTDGHTNGELADTLSDGSFGTAKHIPSLLGVRDANPWAWNGQFRELHEQVSTSFSSTMNGEPLTPPQVNDVVAFLHTLVPPPPVDEGERTQDDRERINEGRQLFDGLGCRQCHVPPVTYSIDLTFDVGLEDEHGLSKFNPPSLRGISQRRRFLHDGRAETLKAVFAEYGHQLNRELAADELQALVAFLQSL